MAKNNEAKAVQDFANPIRESINHLESEITALENKLEGVEELHAELSAKRKQVALLQQTIARLEGTPVKTPRPRGRNLSDITDHLQDNEGGATVREISEATGINMPSVRYTLGSNSQFIRDEKNRWSLQEEA